jgi:uncharacterized protein (UPF0332 family)
MRQPDRDFWRAGIVSRMASQERRTGRRQSGLPAVRRTSREGAPLFRLQRLAASKNGCYSGDMSLEKAEEFLQVAQRCLEEGWYNSAVSRAYYAMFQAARAALAAAGIERPSWRHGSLHATFSSALVRRRKLYPLSFVQNLAEAMELRQIADYSDVQVPQRRATRVVRAATAFLNRVKEVIENA